MATPTRSPHCSGARLKFPDQGAAHGRGLEGGGTRDLEIENKAQTMSDAGHTQFGYEFDSGKLFINDHGVAHLTVSLAYTVSVRHARLAVKFEVKHRGGFFRMEYPPGTFQRKDIASDILTKASKPFFEITAELRCRPLNYSWMKWAFFRPDDLSLSFFEAGFSRKGSFATVVAFIVVVANVGG